MPSADLQCATTLPNVSECPADDESAAFFEFSPLGFVRHWLVAGPKETPYAGPPGPDHVLRRDALDDSVAVPPSAAVLGQPGPFGGSWRYHDPGRNEFVEFSTFYQELAVVEYDAFTEIAADEERVWTARLWAAGAADLWVNGEHLARLEVTRYRNPDCRLVTLPLRKGANRLFVRLQCLGVRDMRMLFGLCLAGPDGTGMEAPSHRPLPVVRMPGAARIARAARWIDGVRAPRKDALESAGPAPFAARVIPIRGEPLCWPAGSSVLPISSLCRNFLAIEAEIDGAVLRRDLEIPANRSEGPALSGPRLRGNGDPAAPFATGRTSQDDTAAVPPVHPPTGDRREAHLSYVARAGLGGEPPANWNAVVLPLMARRLLGWACEQDGAVFAGAIEVVNGRRDCADFVLAGLLRMELLGLCTRGESSAIRRAALAFRYWDDEPGSDAMCFRSENHSLLFHGCQLLAGRLYPGKVFTNSGRTGNEQAALALPRIRHWLEKVEARGFEEFNSGTYMPITIAAMLNAVDFSGAPELSARMAAQIDRIFRDLALHSFGGGVISPQGRAYRDVLFPEESGTQVLLAFATDATDVDLAGPRPPQERTGNWVVFPASSPGYRPPEDLAALVREPVSRVHRHADVQIVLEKTPAYILTSLAVPAVPREGEERADNDLRPGGTGWQQHLWQATLGRDCHVFVNHPGGFFDGTKSRPGYWNGNGLLPRVRQKGNWLQAIHVIADGTKTKPEITPEIWEWGGPATVRPFDLHPVSFTHAHWPSDAFDREARSGNWRFGQKGRGLIGLWCSEPLVPHDDILTGRELRANGYASAWLVICGDLNQAGSLETFMANCAASEPSFDRTAFTLAMKGEETIRWWERSEPMPE